MFRKLFAKSASLIVAGLITMACGAAAAQTVYQTNPAGAATGVSDGGYLTRITVDAPLAITAVGQETSASASTNMKAVIYDESTGSFVFIGPEISVSGDASGVYTFKQSASFAPITLVTGRTYAIGLVTEGAQLIRYNTAPVPAQNGVTQGGYRYAADYLAPAVGGPSTEQFSLLLVSGPPPPQPVPTLSEWAMILLGLMLAGTAAVMVGRRQKLA